MAGRFYTVTVSEAGRADIESTWDNLLDAKRYRDERIGWAAQLGCIRSIVDNVFTVVMEQPSTGRIITINLAARNRYDNDIVTRAENYVASASRPAMLGTVAASWDGDN